MTHRNKTLFAGRFAGRKPEHILRAMTNPLKSLVGGTRFELVTPTMST